MQLPSGLLTEGVPPPCPVGRARAAPTEADWPVQSTGQRACGGRCPAPLAGVENGQSEKYSWRPDLGLVGPHCAPRPAPTAAPSGDLPPPGPQSALGEAGWPHDVRRNAVNLLLESVHGYLEY